ncbi:MAG: hypothetical protein RIQ72_78 [Candidatus Parcubacteria bacterium]|jgi:hypothetical protein
MVIPIVIFFCIALLVNLSHISSSLFLVQQYQREIDRKFTIDMDILRCVRVLERSIWQQGYVYIDKMHASDKGISVYSLPNTYNCIFTVESVALELMGEKEYIFEVLLKSQGGLDTKESISESGGEIGIEVSEIASMPRYTVHVVVTTGDEFYIKRIFIKT